MPALDVRALFMSRSKKTIPASRGRKKAEKAEAPKKVGCRRDGCKNQEIHGYGLCRACYELLKKIPPKQKRIKGKYAERDPLLKEHRYRVGDMAVISQNYNLKEYQGLYVQVVSVEDGGALLTVEFVGDCTDPVVSKAVRDLAGFRIRLAASWCLPIAE